MPHDKPPSGQRGETEEQGGQRLPADGKLRSHSCRSGRHQRASLAQEQTHNAIRVCFRSLRARPASYEGGDGDIQEKRMGRWNHAPCSSSWDGGRMKEISHMYAAARAWRTRKNVSAESGDPCTAVPDIEGIRDKLLSNNFDADSCAECKRSTIDESRDNCIDQSCLGRNQ